MCQEWMDIISFCLKEKAGDIILIQSFGITASRVAGKILESVCVDLRASFAMAQ